MKAKEDQVREKEFRRQGELLASVLKEKFDSVISGVVPGDSSFPSTPTKAAAGPLLPFQDLQPAAGFSPTQLEQVRTLFTDLVPTPEPATLGDSPAGKSGKASSGSKDGGLKPLQVALVNSLFNGKFKVTPETTLEQFQTLVQKKWTQRTIVDTISTFIQEHAPDSQLPKPKTDRIALFGSVLINMD